MKNRTVTVLGGGYVGLPTAVLLAHIGYKVFLVEPDQKRLEVIKQGRSFFFEEGLNSVIKASLKTGCLIPTDSYKISISESNVIFSCVCTPDNSDGSSNLSYVFAAAKETAKYLKDNPIFVQKSTVPVGTGRKIKDLFKESNKEIHYVSNPEFLREGTALYDTLYFDRVVAGGDNQKAVEHILDIYRKLEKYRDTIAALAGITKGTRQGYYIATSLNSAELIKVTSNAFLALKISFANSMAKLADKVNADVVEVMDAVGADERIGRAFLKAGRGYGGGCLPKDVSGLLASAQECGVNLTVMEAAQSINVSMPSYIVDRLSEAFAGQLNGKSVAVLGLSFKAGTSDVRKSPGIEIVNCLLNCGVRVRVYDPQANGEAKRQLSNDVQLVKTVAYALKEVDSVIIATDWPEFISLQPSIFSKHMRGTVIVDAVNCLSPDIIKMAGLHYIGVGRS
jgi:UDPglucose 6-dehydrogenase